MRIMAIDYGDAHTGVAVSDLTGLLAGYACTIHSRRRDEIIRRIGELIGEYGVTELVLGHPKNMDGTLGPRAEKAESFAGELEEGSPLLSEGTKLYLKDLEAGEARVTGYAYDVITDGNGGFSGSADVQFRADDSESRSVLTMGLSYEDGRWLASWVSLRGENGLNYFPEQAAGLQ